MFAEIIAFICTGLFAGAALYVSVVEHPARMSCDLPAALAEFRPSYKRAAVMQVILAVIGVTGAIVAWYLGHRGSVDADRHDADQSAAARRDPHI